MKALVANRRHLEAELLSHFLIKNGYDSAEIVKSGHEALEYLKTNHVDLLLIDMLIPGLDGIQTLRYLRKNFGFTIKTLMMYDHYEHWVERKTLSIGSNGFISRDMKPEEILEILKTL